MARTAALAAVLLIVLVIPAPALAFVPRGGDTVVISDPINDDLYAGGQTIEVNAPIDGDVAAAGYRITISAPVSGTVLAAGATVVIDNRVGRSVRVAAGHVGVSGVVGTDAVLLGRDIRIFERGRVGRDLVAAGSIIRQQGTVGRNAILNGARVVIAGSIAGDVRVNADRLVVMSSAQIGGKLTYSASQDADVRPGARVGSIERVAQPPAQRRAVSPRRLYGFRVFGAVFETVWLLVLGFVALAIGTRGVSAVAERIRRAFWMNLLGGFVLAVAAPVAAILLCVTVIGIPVGVVVLLLYVATLYTSLIFTAMWAGNAVLPRLRGSATTPPSPYLTMLVGIAVLAILMAIPIAGWVIRAVAMLTGFGALWAALWSARGSSTS